MTKEKESADCQDSASSFAADLTDSINSLRQLRLKIFCEGKTSFSYHCNHRKLITVQFAKMVDSGQKKLTCSL